MTAHANDMPMDVFDEDHRWIIKKYDVQLEATGPRLEHAIVRCTLTVRRGERLLYRDAVNLTNARARARLVLALQAQDVTLDDALLLALDDAIRQSPRDRCPTPVSMTISDPPVEFGGTVPTIPELEAQVHRWLRLTDRDVFRLMLAAVAGHRVGSDSL
jgi:hypothetical protein